jgi:predicted transcriptional regulator
MSNSSEEINRKFDIVADHLVTLAVSQQKSEERITRLERVLMLAIRAGLRERKYTRERFDALTEKMGALTDKINDLAEEQKRTDEVLRQLAESQAHTDQRLNALIDIVSQGRNGKAQ